MYSSLVSFISEYKRTECCLLNSLLSLELMVTGTEMYKIGYGDK